MHLSSVLDGVLDLQGDADDDVNGLASVVWMKLLTGCLATEG
jgi:hypothetical protein